MNTRSALLAVATGLAFAADSLLDRVPDGGIDWRHHGRKGVKAYRAKRRRKNRIASRSRARNRA